MTKPENCGTTFCSCIECVNPGGPEWYLKQVDETEPDWRQLAADAAHTMEKARIWGGMDWHYNPLHPIHYTPMLKRLNEALAPLTHAKRPHPQAASTRQARRAWGASCLLQSSDGGCMTDKELLESAAKAYWGDEIDDVCSIRWLEADQAIGYTHGDNQDHNGQDVEYCWNPLTDDGDALRLAARLHLGIRYSVSFPPCDSGASVYVKAYIGWRKPDYEVNHSFAQNAPRRRLSEEDAKFAEYMCRPERNEERWLPNEGAATRRAIVRAAAKIGEDV